MQRIVTSNIRMNDTSDLQQLQSLERALLFRTGSGSLGFLISCLTEIGAPSTAVPDHKAGFRDHTVLAESSIYSHIARLPRAHCRRSKSQLSGKPTPGAVMARALFVLALALGASAGRDVVVINRSYSVCIEMRIPSRSTRRRGLCGRGR